jgi:hypothetical protein
VGGGLDDGSENAPLVPELAKHFTAITYARRGRADSTDTQPYALEREIEDIEALVAEAGGSAEMNIWEIDAHAYTDESIQRLAEMFPAQPRLTAPPACEREG